MKIGIRIKIGTIVYRYVTNQKIPLTTRSMIGDISKVHITDTTTAAAAYKRPSLISIFFNCLFVIPMDWSTANSRLLVQIDVSTALKKDRKSVV